MFTKTQSGVALDSAVQKIFLKRQVPIPPLMPVENLDKTVEKITTLCGNTGESLGENPGKR
jgi:hypothetical protein